ncbi:MAG TPA: carboxypeptidase-like regulatory domain-containing protein, partial [Granulicella sp.]|nr:carboxypeptidase-like regulatory domain-containing protein [Granulicella sp.]
MDRTTRAHSLLRIALLLLASLPLQQRALSQSSTTGAIRGTVTDPSGAVLPNATVTVLSDATGTTRTATTDGSGSYNVGLLPSGTYKVSFHADGFKSQLPESVTVIITETNKVDAALVPGSQDQTVEVSAAPQLLQSESATLGTVVDGKTIQDVPLTERNYTQVLTMSPGVAGDVNNAASLGQGTQNVYVNGGSSISNNFHMDGADINNFGSGSAANFVQQAGIAIPNPDAIEEFKIQTTLYDAGYGRDAGANVDVVTKSGTNQFHGALFEFFRNDIFNANDSFLKFAGQPRPAMKQNQFGGTFGGPILKDKFFFFVTYQG